MSPFVHITLTIIKTNVNMLNDACMIAGEDIASVPALWVNLVAENVLYRTKSANYNLKNKTKKQNSKY